MLTFLLLTAIILIVVATVGETAAEPILLKELEVKGIPVKIFREKDESGKEKLVWDAGADITEEQATQITGAVASALSNDKANMRKLQQINQMFYKSGDELIPRDGVTQEDIRKTFGNDIPNSEQAIEEEIEARNTAAISYMNKKLNTMKAQLSDLGLPESVNNLAEFETIAREFPTLAGNARDYASKLNMSATVAKEQEKAFVKEFDGRCAMKGVDGVAVRAWAKQNKYPLTSDILDLYVSKNTSGMSVDTEMSKEIFGAMETTIARRIGNGNPSPKKTLVEYNAELDALLAKSSLPGVMDKIKAMKAEMDKKFPNKK